MWVWLTLFSAFTVRHPAVMLVSQRGSAPLVDGLETLLLDRSPDFLVVLDGELKVVRASVGLRSAVPLVVPGADFLLSLDESSQARLRQALSIDHDVTSALSLELVHRGKERLITTGYRFFSVDRPYIGGVGREASTELVDQVEVLRRRY